MNDTLEHLVFNNLKTKIGFKKTPMQPGGAGHRAFLEFLSYINAGSPTAAAFWREFGASHNIKGETQEQTVAAFMDWLIVNYWGEESAVNQMAH